MIEKHRLLVVINTFNDLDTIKLTLPSVVADATPHSAKVVVHDCSTENREEIRSWLSRFADESGIFLIMSSRLSLGDARNMAVTTGISLFFPDYICVLEDDHGFKPGMTEALLHAMESHYGRRAPNGMVFGLFSGCPHCWEPPFRTVPLDENDSLPAPDVDPFQLGGANSCFRAAPTAHWQNVLKGYDSDEYMISYWQTKNLNLRNYNNGFTTRYVGNGDLIFRVGRVGQGSTQVAEKRAWDPNFAKSDPRANFYGKA
jgi:glycosyltransferase involved in cell wall biosynthesis